MYRASRADIVSSALDYYRERTREYDCEVPKPYQEIKRKIQRIMEEGRKVLIDIKDSYSVQTVIVDFAYVNDRWAMGYSTCYDGDKEIKVPYTVHFSDIHCKKLNLKFIVEGEKPQYGKKY